ncbi:hypothetical protein B0H17DRAFT_1137129 [Mycena rosella]|uniref:Uncharacterized protein n=1 Tax=Mycena rosella TaxID=1033263 RepID=A0AAD7GFV5_MYCRO|nr:hypothetical protein B0H17DRAFT_1137129 [Mycena rosella]
MHEKRKEGLQRGVSYRTGSGGVITRLRTSSSSHIHHDGKTNTTSTTPRHPRPGRTPHARTLHCLPQAPSSSTPSPNAACASAEPAVFAATWMQHPTPPGQLRVLVPSAGHVHAHSRRSRRTHPLQRVYHYPATQLHSPTRRPRTPSRASTDTHTKRRNRPPKTHKRKNAQTQNRRRHARKKQVKGKPKVKSKKAQLEGTRGKGRRCAADGSPLVDVSIHAHPRVMGRRGRCGAELRVANRRVTWTQGRNET